MSFRLSIHPLLPALLCLLAAGAIPRLAGQTAAQDSPFLPAAGAAAASASDEPLQLSGISVVGKKTYVSIYDSEKKHGSWISVGETVDGVEVVSCDAKSDQAVVRVAKQLKTLTLRAAAVANTGGAAAGAPAPATAPALVFPNTPAAAPAPTGPLTEQAIQEREARMMVSDLLEIGQQQRKAYEEKKAAAEAAAKKDPKP